MGVLASLESFRTLQAAARDPGSVAAAWKARGGKVVGYRCLTVPEELILAAGMLPHPLCGTPEAVGPADAYLQSCSCELVRNLFDRALAGKYAHLDLLLLGNTCDITRKLVDVWNGFIPGARAVLCNHPQKLRNPESRDYAVEELKRTAAAIARVAGADVDPGRLRESIAVTNTTRRLLRDLFALRAEDGQRFSAAEALDVVMGASVLPKPEVNALLARLLGEVRRIDPVAKPGPRILVSGSQLDSPVLLNMIEEEGGVVVAEDLCTSTRYFWHPVPAADDPYEALFRQFDERPICACLHPIGARFDFLSELVDAFRAEAVVYFNIKYCHPFLYEAPIFKQRLEARGVPSIVLEVGHDLSGHGQLRTRLQAFIEMLTL
jgi:benzoyl-CoA reductase/2-hydroxyglutaryl-CoA dehydratase subunit BcrC/BadD/HgdB